MTFGYSVRQESIVRSLPDDPSIIFYRAEKGFDHQKIARSIGVQRMVCSDLAAAWVMFSIDTETGFRDAVLINASYGLGENVVQGSVSPDEFYVFKPTLKPGYRPIVGKRLGSKEFKLIMTSAEAKWSKACRCRPTTGPDSRSRTTRFSRSRAGPA